MKRESLTLNVEPCRTPEEWRAFVERCDDDLEMRMDAVARQVASIPELRFIGLTGPTCSGKTTAARKLTECLEEYGHRVHVISIDDFYYDKDYLHEMAEDDPDVEIDYDSEATIDIDLLREKVESLMACRETLLPRFDFQTGYRVEGKCIQPRESDVFLFEGIQVLYPKVREILNRGIYRCIYIYPASSIEQGGEVFDPEELRLMRRLVRDSRYRGAKAAFTFYLWQSVRANEDTSIFPYVDTCDYRIDSTMPYEVGMLKPYLLELLQDFSPEDPFFKDAETVLQQLRNIPVVSSDYIRENSLYKEFI
ncbi:MAG: hypothetical protein IIU88_04725 [Clostridia bacterium]|nr:hypothetical protein [Clostridia bacterium]MBQ5662280.1 hypothetical protein [Clostridia bacterium]